MCRSRSSLFEGIPILQHFGTLFFWTVYTLVNGVDWAVICCISVSARLWVVSCSCLRALSMWGDHEAGKWGGGGARQQATPPLPGSHIQTQTFSLGRHTVANVFSQLPDPRGDTDNIPVMTSKFLSTQILSCSKRKVKVRVKQSNRADESRHVNFPWVVWIDYKYSF